MKKSVEIKGKLLKNIFQQIKGLMFCFKQEKILIFKLKSHKNCIHTWFVFFPIYAIWLDENKKVLRIDYCRPFQLRTWCCENSKWLIEVPEKIFISKNMNENIKIGVKLKISDELVKN